MRPRALAASFNASSFANQRLVESPLIAGWMLSSASFAITPNADVLPVLGNTGSVA